MLDASRRLVSRAVVGAGLGAHEGLVEASSEVLGRPTSRRRLGAAAVAEAPD
jgi:hypothetical protein